MQAGKRALLSVLVVVLQDDTYSRMRMVARINSSIPLLFSGLFNVTDGLITLIAQLSNCLLRLGLCLYPTEQLML